MNLIKLFSSSTNNETTNDSTLQAENKEESANTQSSTIKKDEATEE
jgi:hypothetical protein